jgi:hypothetical protein
VVTVMVMPPAGAAVGTHAEIPVTVAYPMVMSNRVPGLAAVGANAATIAGAFSQLYSPGIHMMGVGALTVLGRVTGGQGALRLASVASDPAGRGRYLVSGTLTPGEPNEPITLEYISGHGSKAVHVVYTANGGAFTDVYDAGRERGHEQSGEEDRGRERVHTDGDEAGKSEDLATPFSAAPFATVQAHWAGDNAHDPTDSEPLPLAPSH